MAMAWDVDVGRVEKGYVEGLWENNDNLVISRHMNATHIPSIIPIPQRGIIPTTML